MSAKHKSAGKRKWNVVGILALLILIAAIGAAVYIMANGLGLIDSLDFGAGAYYYADIPAFQRFVDSGAYTSETPMWVIVVLFLFWGWLMYRLWVWLDRRSRRRSSSKP